MPKADTEHTTARDTGRTRPDTIATPRRRGLLTGTIAALLTGAAAVATAKAAPLPVTIGDDATLIQLAATATAARQSLNAMSAEYDEMEMREVSADEARDFDERTEQLLGVFWDASDRAEMIRPVTIAGYQAKAAILLLVLEQTVATGIDATLEDIARREVGEPADRFGLALARDLVASGRAAP